MNWAWLLCDWVWAWLTESRTHPPSCYPESLIFSVRCCFLWPQTHQALRPLPTCNPIISRKTPLQGTIWIYIFGTSYNEARKWQGNHPIPVQWQERCVFPCFLGKLNAFREGRHWFDVASEGSFFLVKLDASTHSWVFEPDPAWFYAMCLMGYVFVCINLEGKKHGL